MFFKQKTNKIGQDIQDSPLSEYSDSKENPYLNARQEWLERYGSYIARASQWRMVAFMALAICILSITGNVIQAGQYKVVPYIVAVDSVGNTKAINRADGALARKDVPQTVIQSELVTFIDNWRSVTPDLDLQKRKLNKLGKYVAGDAQGYMREWFAENNPYAKAQETLVTVEIKGLPQPVSANSWRIEWTETMRNHAGMLMDSVQWEATLTIGILPPKTEQDIIGNPCGVMVTSVFASKILQQ